MRETEHCSELRSQASRQRTKRRVRKNHHFRRRLLHHNSGSTHTVRTSLKRFRYAGWCEPEQVRISGAPLIPGSQRPHLHYQTVHTHTHTHTHINAIRCLNPQVSPETELYRSSRCFGRVLFDCQWHIAGYIVAPFQPNHRPASQSAHKKDRSRLNKNVLRAVRTETA